MTTVHVVVRVTGQYEDRQEAVIVAYPTEALAQEHIVKAEAAARGEYLSDHDLPQDATDDEWAAYDRREKETGWTPFDPELPRSEAWSGDVRYHFASVELREALPA